MKCVSCGKDCAKKAACGRCGLDAPFCFECGTNYGLICNDCWDAIETELGRVDTDETAN